MDIFIEGMRDLGQDFHDLGTEILQRVTELDALPIPHPNGGTEVHTSPGGRRNWESPGTGREWREVPANLAPLGHPAVVVDDQPRLRAAGSAGRAVRVGHRRRDVERLLGEAGKGDGDPDRRGRKPWQIGETVLAASGRHVRRARVRLLVTGATRRTRRGRRIQLDLPRGAIASPARDQRRPADLRRNGGLEVDADAERRADVRARGQPGGACRGATCGHRHEQLGDHRKRAHTSRTARDAQRLYAGYVGRHEDGAPLIDPEFEVVEVGDGVLVSLDVTTVVSSWSSWLAAASPRSPWPEQVSAYRRDGGRATIDAMTGTAVTPAASVSCGPGRLATIRLDRKSGRETTEDANSDVAQTRQLPDHVQPPRGCALR